MYVFFFFQAEDGIRDGHVTGVQTCALPICSYRNPGGPGGRSGGRAANPRLSLPTNRPDWGGGGHRKNRQREEGPIRSEERRVGKECRARWWRDQGKKKRESEIEEWAKKKRR